MSTSQSNMKEASARAYARTEPGTCPRVGVDCASIGSAMKTGEERLEDGVWRISAI